MLTTAVKVTNGWMCISPDKWVDDQKPAVTSGFLLPGIIRLFSSKRSLPGVILLSGFDCCFYSLTLVKPKIEPVLITFSTASGEKGNIAIEILRRYGRAISLQSPRGSILRPYQILYPQAWSDVWKPVWKNPSLAGRSALAWIQKPLSCWNGIWGLFKKRLPRDALVMGRCWRTGEPAIGQRVYRFNPRSYGSEDRKRADCRQPGGSGRTDEMIVYSFFRKRGLKIHLLE